MQARSIFFLRVALGITFFWFGILKLFNASPVISVIKEAMPQQLVSLPMFFFLLALFEIMIGLALLANKFVKIGVIVMIGHLLIVTVAVLVTQGFDPWFPVLSLEGEFVVKNLVLIAGGFILLTEGKKEKET